MTYNYVNKRDIVNAVQVPKDNGHNRDFEGWGRLAIWLGQGSWEINTQLGVNLPGGFVAGPSDWIVRTHTVKGFMVVPDSEFKQTYVACTITKP